VVYVFGEILFWLLAALILGGALAVLWMRLVMGARGEEQLAPLRDRIATLEGERDSLRREVGEARDRSTERETQLSALKDDLESRDGKIVSQAAEIERLREMAAKPEPAGDVSESPLKAELEATQARIAQRDAEISELRAALENAREAYHHLEAAQFGAEPRPAANELPPPTPNEPATPAGRDEPVAGEGETDEPVYHPQPVTPPREEDPEEPDYHPRPVAQPRPEEAEEPVYHPRPVPRPRDEAGGAAASDDLTQIKGIGKVLETKLNAMGINSFAQIAAFSPEDVARLGAELTPKGRIERDGWIDQARALVEGRRTDEI